MARSRDLFDDTTMSFGEHLEVLRVHVFRAGLGAMLCVIVCLFFGDRVFSILRAPIERVLATRGISVENDAPTQTFWEYLQGLFGSEPVTPDADVKTPEMAAELRPDQLRVSVSREELRRHGMVLAASDSALHDLDTKGQDNKSLDNSGQDVAAADTSKKGESVQMVLTAPEFAQLHQLIKEMSQVTTLKAEEGFVTYIKVCSIAGFVVASPWVFYQLWLFVASGLHPHERKYVYVYLPMSLVLFLAGAYAGFFYAFPLMLQFFVSFNTWLNISMQPRLSEYISLALILPLMFGISFQLPLVMLFLERIGIFTVDQYKGNRRMAILVIAILSMVLTTSPDPGSMILMMIPLIFLYEVGIHLCRFRISAPPAPIQ